MLDDKTMVSDALAGVNGELVRYGEMISQTENKELKACLKQLRNECEMSQEKLYHLYFFIVAFSCLLPVFAFLPFCL